MQLLCPFFFIFPFALFFTSCKNNSSKKVSLESSTIGDTISILNNEFNEYKTSIINKDTSKINYHFNKYYETVDSLLSLQVYNNRKMALGYLEKVNTFIDTVSEGYIFQPNLLFQKSRALQYLIYYNYHFEKNNEQIKKFYNELVSEKMKPFIKKEKLLNRMHEAGVAYNKIGDEAQTEKIYNETLALANELKSFEDIAKATENKNVLLLKNGLYDSVITASSNILIKIFQ
jgi:hypothetical protein